MGNYGDYPFIPISPYQYPLILYYTMSSLDYARDDIEASVLIFDFRGAGLFYRNKKYSGIVHEVQPTIFCLGWDKDAL